MFFSAGFYPFYHHCTSHQPSSSAVTAPGTALRAQKWRKHIPVKADQNRLGSGGTLGNSLSGKVQGRFLVLGLVSEAVLPGEAQHVLDRVVDAQPAGVVERGAALVILAA